MYNKNLHCIIALVCYCCPIWWENALFLFTTGDDHFLLVRVVNRARRKQNLTFKLSWSSAGMASAGQLPDSGSSGDSNGQEPERKKGLTHAWWSNWRELLSLQPQVSMRKTRRSKKMREYDLSNLMIWYDHFWTIKLQARMPYSAVHVSTSVGGGSHPRKVKGRPSRVGKADSGRGTHTETEFDQRCWPDNWPLYPERLGSVRQWAHWDTWC